MFPFYTSWKHQKAFGLLVFLGIYTGNIGQEWVKGPLVSSVGPKPGKKRRVEPGVSNSNP